MFTLLRLGYGVTMKSTNRAFDERFQSSFDNVVTHSGKNNGGLSDRAHDESHGEDSDDMISGRRDNDVLAGGPGNDTYVAFRKRMRHGFAQFIVLLTAFFAVALPHQSVWHYGRVHQYEKRAKEPAAPA